MHEIDSTQRQVQEQKVRLHGVGVGHWIGEVLRYAFFFTVLIIAILVFLWVFGGDNGRYTDLGVLFVLAVFSLWCLYHGGAWVKYRADKAEIDSHFHDVSSSLSIGDRSTEGFIPFYVPPFPEEGNVKDEVSYTPPPQNSEVVDRYATSLPTLSQQRERLIQDKYYEDGLTMAEIVKAMQESSVFDPPSLHDVRKALGKTGKEKKNEQENN